MYRFVSDPNFNHTETLSGRVTAACVTCRRRVGAAEIGLRDHAKISEQKTRCDGGMPCKTCKEKGVACEGFIERRKPRKRVTGRRTVEAGSPVSCSDASTCSTDLSEVVTPILDPAEIYDQPSMFIGLPSENFDFAHQDDIHNPLDLMPTLWPDPNGNSVDWIPRYSSPWLDPTPKNTSAPDLLLTASILEEQARTLRQIAVPNPTNIVSTVPERSALPLLTYDHMQELLPPSYINTPGFTVGPLESCTSEGASADLSQPPVIRASNEQVTNLAQSLPISNYAASLSDHSKAGCTCTYGDSGLGFGSKAWDPKFRKMIAQLNAAKI